MKNFKEYQEFVNSLKIYPYNSKITYPVLGLNGEAGEVAEKVKKVIRDKEGVFSDLDINSIAKELGDCLFYVAACADDLGYTLEEVAQMNIDKLKSRQERNKLGGSGDDR